MGEQEETWEDGKRVMFALLIRRGRAGMQTARLRGFVVRVMGDCWRGSAGGAGFVAVLAGIGAGLRGLAGFSRRPCVAGMVCGVAGRIYAKCYNCRDERHDSTDPARVHAEPDLVRGTG